VYAPQTPVALHPQGTDHRFAGGVAVGVGVAALRVGKHSLELLAKQTGRCAFLRGRYLVPSSRHSEKLSIPLLSLSPPPPLSLLVQLFLSLLRAQPLLRKGEKTPGFLPLRQEGGLEISAALKS
jgi:hypothetical protein